MRKYVVLSMLVVSALLMGQERNPHVITPDRKLAIKVTLNGDPVEFKDAVPIMVASRILVPMRGVFERLGATLQWNASTNRVTAQANGKAIELRVGKDVAIIDGKTVRIDQPPVLYHGRTLVPLRFLSESLGAKVDWLTADRTVAIVTER